MIRNLKALGLALMALLALGAVMASGASAQEQGVLTSDGPVTLTGEEVGEPTENRLTAFGAHVKCPGSTYTGHAVKTHAETTATEEEEGKEKHEPLPAASVEATLTPHYKGGTEGPANCTGPLGISATVHMNGCDYVAHIGETTPVENTDDTYGVTFDVVCPPGQEITVTLWRNETEHTNKPETPFCDIHVGDEHEVEGEKTPTNQGLPGAHATDLGNGTIRLHGTVVGISAKETETESSVLCNNAEENEAKFDLNVIVSGHDGNEPGKETAISISEE